MSTKATISNGEDFHIYEELADNPYTTWLEFTANSLNDIGIDIIARSGLPEDKDAPPYMRICVQLPKELATLLREKLLGTNS